MIPVSIVIGLLCAMTQYFKYKNTGASYILKKIALPTLVAAIITTSVAIFYPLTYYKEGGGFLGAVYVAMFAAIYAAVTNAAYIWVGLKGKLSVAGGSVAHVGFAIMLAGMLISSSNKKVISDSSANGINLPAGKDPMTRQQDDPTENLTLVRQLPTRMGPYTVTYLRDSSGSEKGRKFYELLFERIDPVSKKRLEHFTLWPDVYLMKDNNMSSNPDTKSYKTKDIFTYISFAMSEEKTADTTQFKTTEMAEGDTAFYSNGIIILNRVVRSPDSGRYHFKPTDLALMADITLVSKDSMHYAATPLIHIDNLGINHIDDTVYAQNMFLRFEGVAEGRKVKIGVKETDKIIDFVTVKAYIFPYINLVWSGLIIMAIGLIMSAIRRAKLSTLYAAAALLATGAALFYMFLLANN